MTTAGVASAAPSLSIVIVTWHSAAEIGTCLESIARQEYGGPLEVHVWDNASTDGTVALVRERHPGVRLTASPDNLGFGRGNNAAAAGGESALVLFLNPDTVLPTATTLAELVTALATAPPSIGIVAPRLENRDGSFQASPAPFPGPLKSAVTAFGLHFLLPAPARARLATHTVELADVREVDWVKGAAVLIRRTVFERLGGWSESTFMYGEDVDLCLRARRLGFRTRYVGTTTVVHLDDASASKRWSDADRAARTAAAELSMLRVHQPRWRAELTRAVVVTGFGARAVLLRLAGRRSAADRYRVMARAYLRPGRS